MSWNPQQPGNETTPVAWSTYPAIQAVDMAGEDLNQVDRIYFGANELYTVGTDLFYNGNQVNVGPLTSVADWANFQAVNDINMAFNDINFAGTVNAFEGTFGVGALSLLYALRAFGNVAFDGGAGGGFSATALPVGGINTARIELIGGTGIIEFTSPTSVVTTATTMTTNLLGAGNIAAAGALAFAAGSYVTLEHGAGLGANGIFIQNTTNDASARLEFSFGGSIIGPNNLTFNVAGGGGNITNLATINGKVNPFVAPFTPKAATAVIVCTTLQNGFIYGLTSGTVQDLTTTLLGVGDVGWYCVLKNATAGNISVTENTSPIAGVIAPSGIGYVYWNGTGLTLY
jgi:hypothetical protein